MEKVKLNTALLAAQKAIKVAVKDAKNPHFGNDYSSLLSVIDAVKDACNNAGIVITQPMEMSADKWVVISRLTHAESGEFVESSMPIIAKDMNDPQKWGSAITYARRYTLQSLIALPSDDDDGNGANDPPKSKQTPPTPKQKQEVPPTDNVKAVAKRNLWATAKKHGLDTPAKIAAYAEANGITVPLADMTAADMNTLEGKMIVNKTKGQENA
jgi:hypothetical protein